MKLQLRSLLPCSIILCAVSCIAPELREPDRESQAIEAAARKSGVQGFREAENLYWDARELDKQGKDAPRVRELTLEAIKKMWPDTPKNMSYEGVVLLHDISSLAATMAMRAPESAWDAWRTMQRRERRLREANDQERWLAASANFTGSAPSGEFLLKERPKASEETTSPAEPGAGDSIAIAGDPTPSEMTADNKASKDSSTRQAAISPAPDLMAALEAVQQSLSEEDLAAATDELSAAIHSAAVGHSPNDSRLVSARMNLAKLLLAQERLAEARQLLEEALASLFTQFPVNGPLVLQVRKQLVEVQVAQGDFGNAREQAEEVYSADSSQGSTSGDDLDASMHRLSSILYALNDRRGLEALRNMHPPKKKGAPSSTDSDGSKVPDDIDQSHLMLQDARASLDAGKFPLAIEKYTKILETEKQDENADPRDEGAAGLGLATAYEGMGDLERANRVLSEMEKRYRKKDPKNNYPRRDVSKARSKLLEELGDQEGAGVVLMDMHDDFSGAMPPNHPLVVGAKQDIADWKQKNSDPQGAETYQREVYDTYSDTLPNDHPSLLEARRKLILLLQELGRYEEALALIEGELGAGTMEASYNSTQSELVQLALRYQRNCQFPQALEVRERILANLQHSGQETDLAVVEAMREVAALQRVMTHLNQARQLEGQIQLAEASAADRGHELLLATAGSPPSESEPTYPPMLVLGEAKRMPSGEFEIVARAEASLGLTGLHIVQDGARLRAPTEGNGWSLDSTGTKGELKMAFRIPEGQSISVVSISAQDPRRVSSDFDTVVLRL